MIEFSGELSDKYKKYYLNKTKKMLWLTALVIFVIVGIPLVAIGIAYFSPLITIPAAIGFLAICLIVPAAVSASFSPLDGLTEKVLIENGEIVALNSKEIASLGHECGGIESLSIDGYFNLSVKSILDVVKVVDYGEWYYIFFIARHIFSDYVCQKDLIVKGTIEDFERLFEGKIVRKCDKKK
ncbi:MAG: hypothetical protein FWD86_02230 [Firmicutes bacterium]|nr:hypothetical protein [Bacillota bacterium]